MHNQGFPIYVMDIFRWNMWLEFFIGAEISERFHHPKCLVYVTFIAINIESRYESKWNKFFVLYFSTLPGLALTSTYTWPSAFSNGSDFEKEKKEKKFKWNNFPSFFTLFWLMVHRKRNVEHSKVKPKMFYFTKKKRKFVFVFREMRVFNNAFEVVGWCWNFRFAISQWTSLQWAQSVVVILKEIQITFHSR